MEHPDKDIREDYDPEAELEAGPEDTEAELIPEE